MALAVVTSGTAGPVTLNVESSLSTQTPGSPTTYVARVDCAALALGESAVVRVYSKTLLGGTERVEQAITVIGGADPEVALTTPCPTDVSFRVGVTQTGGTGRSYPWKLLSL